MDEKPSKRFYIRGEITVPQCLCEWGKPNLRCPYLETFDNLIVQAPHLFENNRDKDHHGDNGRN